VRAHARVVAIARVAAIATGAILTAAGCTLILGEDLVDGWPVGEQIVDCTDRSDALDCAPYLAPGFGALGGATAGTSVTLHREGSYAGGAKVTRLGGAVTVLVVTAFDGSRRAIGLACGLVVSGQIPTCDVVPPPSS
jgi:hypothetical protein